MCFFVQTNHTRKELLFLMFKEINLRNHSSLHKLFYSLWGYGISNDGNYFNILDTHMVNQSDLGILSMLFQYGIIGFAIFISPFVMGLYVSLKKVKFVQNKFLFLLTCTTALTSIMSQNMYDPFRFLIVPFLLSFISVVSFMNKKEN
ncbi:hypothetical protein HMPREF9250_00519 [Lactobacillus crispatus FB049-03]|nr:hypothetical protein HMPREF9250_00519 [Lactobacillus crispatus FB049-03]